MNRWVLAGIVAGVAAAGMGVYEIQKSKAQGQTQGQGQGQGQTYTATWYPYGLAEGDQATIVVNGTSYTVQAGQSLTISNLSGDVQWQALDSEEGAIPYPASGVVTPSNNNVYIRYTYTTPPPPPPPIQPLNVSIEITPVSQISAVFSDPTYGPAPVTLEAKADVSGGVPPYSYEWNFGNGQTSTSNPAEVTYSQAGTYTISLTVTDSIGEKASAQTQVTVFAPLSVSISLSQASSSGYITPM